MKKRILFLTGICAFGFIVCKAHASVPHHPQQNNINVEMEDNHIPSEARFLYGNYKVYSFQMVLTDKLNHKELPYVSLTHSA